MSHLRNFFLVTLGGLVEDIYRIYQEYPYVHRIFSFNVVILWTAGFLRLEL